MSLERTSLRLCRVASPQNDRLDRELGTPEGRGQNARTNGTNGPGDGAHRRRARTDARLETALSHPRDGDGVRDQPVQAHGRLWAPLPVPNLRWLPPDDARAGAAQHGRAAVTTKRRCARAAWSHGTAK